MVGNAEKTKLTVDENRTGCGLALELKMRQKGFSSLQAGGQIRGACHVRLVARQACRNVG